MSPRSRVRWLFAGAIALTGCSALLDVKDIFLDPNAAQGGQDVSSDGKLDPDGAAGDGGADGGSCVANLQTDKKNCGRCGHDCLGGNCSAGKCQALELATIGDAPLMHVVVSAQHVFVSTLVTQTGDVAGIWRIPKAGGGAEKYVTTRYAEQMAILGDTLYFVVEDYAADTGGFYSCPLLGPSPCSPTRIAPAETPRGITTDTGRVFYGDDSDPDAGKGLMLYTPGGAPTVFREGYGFPRDFFVDGTHAFYAITYAPSNPPQHATVFEALTDGGVLEKYSYDTPTANSGILRGSADALFFTAFDYATTTGGVVRRIPRNAAALPCDYGAANNKRPYGIHADANRIFWTNLGGGTARPYTGGSVATCALAGCCAMPETLWTGDGQPSGLTGDADAVYFVTTTKGGVWKIAKP